MKPTNTTCNSSRIPFPRWLPTLLMILAASAVQALPASADPITPKGTTDTLVVDGTCTLGDAIEAANTDQTTVGGCVDVNTGADFIVLDTGVVLTVPDTVRSTEIEGSFAGLPDVTSEITIQAGTADQIVRDLSLPCDAADRPDEFRLLQVLAGGDLMLDGLTLENGCAQNGAGLLVDAAAVLTVVDSGLRGHTAFYSGVGFPLSDGGAIFGGAGSEIYVADSIVEDNLIECQSSPICKGGGIYAAGLLSMSGSEFRNNRVRDGDKVLGGAVYLNSPSPIAWTDLIFEENGLTAGDANALGGAVCIEGVGSPSSLERVRFVGNEALAGTDTAGRDAYAGALYIYDELGSLIDVSFVDNLAQGGAGDTTSGGDAYGGALYRDADGIVERNVTYSGNRAVGGDSTSSLGGSAFGGAAAYDTGSGGSFHVTVWGNEAIAGTGGTGDGTAVGGGLWINGSMPLGTSVFEANQIEVGGLVTAEDCFDSGTVGTPRLTSLGYSIVSAPGNCTFDGPGDVDTAAPSLLPIGDHGCVTPLPDGSCLPTHPVDLGTDAHDQGSCTDSGATTDARGFSRPWDGDPVNADDGCDAGAYEARDEDEGIGDGVEDGVDNCPDDVNPTQDDSDLDGLGDPCDACFGDNSTGDTDTDGVCDDSDVCPGSDDGADADGDTIPDGCDLCFGDNSTGDSDSDGVCNDSDLCLGDDATGDGDGDGLCANLDCDDGDATNACGPIFDDGFESGDVSAWSSSVP